MSSAENFGLNIEQFKVYFFKGVRLWYVLIIGLIIGTSVGFYKARYNVPTYKVDGRVLVKEEWKGYGADAFLPGMEIVNERHRLANEVGIIKSYPLMLNVVRDIPELKVSYYDIGNVRRTELYKKSPFKVNIDTVINNKIYNPYYSIKIIDENSYLISEKDFKDDVGIEYHFGDTILLKENRISIDLENFAYRNITNKKFQFQVNNLRQLAKRYQDMTAVSVDVDEASSILVISLTGTNINKEIDVTNSIMQNFIQYGLDEGNEKGVNTLLFVTEQLEIVKDSLVQAEAELESFKEITNTKRLNLEGENIIKQVTDLETKRLELEFTIEFSANTIDYIKNKDDAKGIVIPYYINSQSVLYQLMVNLINKYSRREKLKFKVEEASSTMQLLNNEIEFSKTILLENLNTLKSKSENDLNIINNQIRFIEGKLLHLPNAERQQAIAIRNYTVQNTLYTFLLTKQQEASIAKASSIPKAKILDYATDYRVKRVSVTNTSIYIKYLSIFFVLSIILIVLIELSYTKVIDKNDVTRLTDIPIIGNIGHNESENNLVLFEKPKSLISEAFRTVRTNIQYLSQNHTDSRVIMLTSSVSGEGKTFCSMNVASSYALLGKKTILVGADLRKPRIYDDFNVSNDIGLSTILIEKCSSEEATQKTPNESLDLITSGPIPPNPSELLSSDEFKKLIVKLKSQYDRIILDTSPIGLVTDARILIDISDVLLLIIRQKYTSLSNLKKIDEELTPHKHKSGILVNDIEQQRIGYGGYSYGYGGYSYGYGYGYGYGYYDEDQESSRKKKKWRKKKKK